MKYWPEGPSACRQIIASLLCENRHLMAAVYTKVRCSPSFSAGLRRMSPRHNLPQRGPTRDHRQSRIQRAEVGLTGPKDILIDGPKGITIRDLKGINGNTVEASLEIASDAPVETVAASPQ